MVDKAYLRKADVSNHNKVISISQYAIFNFWKSKAFQKVLFAQISYLISLTEPKFKLK